ncbi:NAD(P)-binding domain-containing protein [Streptomyces sp. BH-SS-21]|uniref:NAD(P)-binding domain-containing protein n=1 Tax=Streptomyces liliiviolaceus TaxID=2823109 RepID=A0A940Y544_9ACTN|nr:NAD(P)/FAD-dependent oxidoreductase [Streptomyces liliiviolaceus]MBQ0850764.1 NAD(P)-binding domain-containing protein [Streptomyces liliiviolaceus]
MKQPLKVAVVGAGMSGLFMGHHLKNAGMRFTIYEKRSAAGGTWDTNTYPGLHVDVLTRNYEFPFARGHHWTKRYAPGEEVRRYLADFAETRNLLPHIEFDTEVTSAAWENGVWTLTLADGSTSTADIVVTATGFLRTPAIPKVPGADTFLGKQFHSSRWDHSLDLKDKSVRYGVVGTGSSGVQIVSALGKTGADVTHYIRTPQWMQVKDNPRYTLTEKLVLRIPPLARRYDRKMAELRVKTDGNETWRLVPGPDREEMKRRFLKMLEDEIPDPELRAKFTPTEPLGVKRIAKTPDYYRVAQQDNVHPVFGGIRRVEPHGIVDDRGTLHRHDVIVWATGFDAHAYMRPMRVTGPEGLTMDAAWRDGVTAFRGIGVPRFPNFFLLCGPFAPVNSLTIPTTLAHEVGYLMRLFDVIARTGQGYAPSEAATKAFVDEVREALPGTTYSEGDNWYSQEVGVPIIWPFTRARHEEQYAELQMSDFDAYPAAEPSPAADPSPVADPSPAATEHRHR